MSKQAARSREGSGWPQELRSLATVRDGLIRPALVAYRGATIGRSRRPPSDLKVGIRPANTPNFGSHLPERTSVALGQRRESSYHTTGSMGDLDGRDARSEMFDNEDGHDERVTTKVDRRLRWSMLVLSPLGSPDCAKRSARRVRVRCQADNGANETVPKTR